MSRFKVGDRVRRISNREQRLEVSNIDMSDGTFYAAAENLWYFQHDFELVSPPQPVESPDDWVEITDPNHVPRVGVDWFEGVSLHDVIRRHADLINNGKSLLSWYQVLLAATHDRPFQRHEFQNVLHLAMESLSRAYQEDRGRWVLHAMTTATWCNSVSH